MPPKKTKLKAPAPKAGGSWADLDAPEEQDEADAEAFLALFSQGSAGQAPTSKKRARTNKVWESMAICRRVTLHA